MFVYDSVDEVDFSKLPEKFVFKPNNSSGRIVICNDKKQFDESKAIKTMKKWENE